MSLAYLPLYSSVSPKKLRLSSGEATLSESRSTCCFGEPSGIATTNLLAVGFPRTIIGSDAVRGSERERRVAHLGFSNLAALVAGPQLCIATASAYR